MAETGFRTLARLKHQVKNLPYKMFLNEIDFHRMIDGMSLGDQNGSHLHTDEVRCRYGIDLVVTNEKNTIMRSKRNQVSLHAHHL